MKFWIVFFLIVQFLLAALQVEASVSYKASYKTQLASLAKKQELLIKIATASRETLQPKDLQQIFGAEIDYKYLGPAQSPTQESIQQQFSWYKIQNSFSLNALKRIANHPSVRYIQPNFDISLLEEYKIKDPLRRSALNKMVNRMDNYIPTAAPSDNPNITTAFGENTLFNAEDPFVSKQWGLQQANFAAVYKKYSTQNKITVALLDTGVDYAHEDLAPNIWTNLKEIPDNGLDDDKNGYVDDNIGWDFVSNDNKPFDLTTNPLELIFKGGNPGHGTHSAGTIAAVQANGMGISGVAPSVQIMPLRCLNTHGMGSTAEAILAIQYAVNNGALILSSSWGTQLDLNIQDLALQEAIQYAEQKGVLFITAAGNGRNGLGFDNDHDQNPVFPASYDMENIIAVTAINSQNQLAPFSNWGAKSVDLAAPGVEILSTMIGNKYSDAAIDKLGMKATWDGTSMAVPFVAGAAALYWSYFPQQTWQQVKSALLNSVSLNPQLTDKVLSGGQLNLEQLMQNQP